MDKISIVDHQVQQPEDDGLEEVTEPDEQLRDEWMVMAGKGPNEKVEVAMGRRDIDLQHNWHATDNQYGDVSNLQKFIIVNKRNNNLENPQAETITTGNFNGEQLRVSLLENETKLQITSHIIIDFNKKIYTNIVTLQKIMLNGKFY